MLGESTDMTFLKDIIVLLEKVAIAYFMRSEFCCASASNDNQVNPACKRSEVKGKPGGNPEPGDRLFFVFFFVSCVACVRAGEAKL